MVSKRKFNKIKENDPESRIWKRTWQEQKTRNKLASVLRKKHKRLGEWKWVDSLLSKQYELEDKKLDFEISNLNWIIDTEEFSEKDLAFLENLSDSNLKKVKWFDNHWVRSVRHTFSDDRWNSSAKYPYYPKYVFLYEVCKDKASISDTTKNRLKSCAKAEVHELVYDEIKNDTFLYSYWESVIKHIFEYLPQKEVAEMMIYTRNMWTYSCIDVLLKNIDYFTELDDAYKKHINDTYEKFKKDWLI